MHRFQLQAYHPKHRYRCPQCNHREKTFSRYIDTETNQQLADHVGRCSRENNCGYHFKPREYFGGAGSFELAVGGVQWAAGNRQYSVSRNKPSHKLPTANCIPPTPTYIHSDIANASFSNWQHNNFVQYLIKCFGFDVADTLVGRYRIGTCSHWPGATVFWQLDGEGLLRTGKIMLYNAQNGHRVKQPYSHIQWAHKLLSADAESDNRHLAIAKITKGMAAFNYHLTDFEPIIQAFHLNQCLFGGHLLNQYPTMPVAIAESEKTAIMSSVQFAEFIWLAAGSLHNINPGLCAVLKGRKVYLFPDLNCYDKWRSKARELNAAMPGTRFKVFEGLELIANDAEKKLGLDLGDLVGGS